MAVYSLGSFTFINLHGTSAPGGAPETVRQTSVPVQRPGVAGTGFITTGIKAESAFEMRSIVDVTTAIGAQALIIKYEEAVGSGLKALVHANADYSATPVYNWYWIMSVRAGWRRVSAAVGGLNGGLYVVEAIWSLIPVYVAPEE